MIAANPDPTPPEASNNYLLKTWRVLLRHRFKAGVFFIGTMALITIGALLAPKTYQSEAKLFVRIGRESVTLDPTATTGKVVGVHETRENEINSVLEVMQSRTVLERAVDRLTPQVILSAKLPEDGTNPKATDSNAAGRDQAILRLERMVYVKHGKKSSVITIGCKAASPELAQRIVKVVLEEFRGLHLKVNRTAGSRKFFATQVKLLDGKLKTATAELKVAKNDLGLTTLDNRRKTLQELVRTNRASAQTNAADLSGVRASISSLKKSLLEVPKTVAQSVVGFPNGSLDRTRSQLNTLRIEERKLLTRWTKHHPEVIAIREQITEIEKILKGERSNGTQSTTVVNPAWQQLQVRLTTERAREQSLSSKATAIENEHAGLLTDLRTLNGSEGRIAQLEQNVQLLQASHKAYSERLEQARIDWALGEDRISNVNVVQPPTYVAKAVGPKKRLIVFLGLIVAAIGSIGFAWVLEYRSTRTWMNGEDSTDRVEPNAIRNPQSPIRNPQPSLTT